MTEAPWSFEHGLFGGSWTWPERGQVVLVLDGIAIDDLPLKIYQWSQGQSEAEWLYTGTPWEPVKNQSPWLVYPEHPDDPVLTRFLGEQAVREAGYLLVSPHDRPTIASAMRCLLHVERVEGIPELLRIGHPAMARSVIGERLLDARDWPFNALIAPDGIEEQWILYEQTNSGLMRQDQNDVQPALAVDDRLLEAFRQFNQRQSVVNYLQATGEAVEAWLGPGTRSDHINRLRIVFNLADQWRFNTPRSRSLFLALLQRSATRPWSVEALPDALVDHLKGPGSDTDRLNNALQAVPSSASSPTTTQG